MTEEKINEIQSALDRKRRQEAMRKDYKYKQAMNEIKDIFMDSFSLQPPDSSRPILEKLSNIVDQINNEDHDTNAKLMEWSEKKIQAKVNQKLANDIILRQVDLAKKLDKVKIVLGNTFSLYRKLCDFSRFTQEITPKILSLERKLKLSSMQLPSNPANSKKHFSQTLHTQRELVALSVEEATIKEKLMQIQASITPHLEVLHKEKMYAETVLKKDPNISTHDGLVDLIAELAIQHKSLDIALNNWDAALKIILEVNKTFLAKHGITI